MSKHTFPMKMNVRRYWSISLSTLGSSFSFWLLSFMLPYNIAWNTGEPAAIITLWALTLPPSDVLNVTCTSHVGDTGKWDAATIDYGTDYWNCLCLFYLVEKTFNILLIMQHDYWWLCYVPWQAISTFTYRLRRHRVSNWLALHIPTRFWCTCKWDRWS